MAIHLSLGVLLGTIIGAVAVSLSLAIGAIVVTQRLKHRRLMAQTNVAGERRLSRYPGGNMSITDEDVSRIPGTGAAFRTTLQASRPRQPTYMPMSSREDVEDSANANKRSNEKTEIQEKMQWKDYEDEVWQLSRRFKRANGHPILELQSTPLSPVNEGKSGDNARPKKQAYIKSAQSIILRADSDEEPRERDIEVLRLKLGSSVEPGLKPKPLFHDKRRSVSHGVLSDSRGRHTNTNETTPIRWNNQKVLPRSISLCSQEASDPPTRPMPTLPPEAAAIRRQRSVISARNSIRYSKSGPNLGEKWRADSVFTPDYSNSKDAPQLRASTTSLTLALPKVVHCHGREGSIPSRFELDRYNSMRQEASDPNNAAQTTMLNIPLEGHTSRHVSSRDSLHRSESGTGSIPNTPISQREPPPLRNSSSLSTAPKARSLHPSEPHISAFDFGLPLPSSDSVPINTEANPHNSKRLSASILQNVSGNEKSLSRPKRPSSIATEYPIRQEQFLVLDDEDVENMYEENSQCGTQKVVSISPLLAYSGSCTDSQSCWPQPRSSAIQSLRPPRLDPPSFRPPSCSTFDPEISPGSLQHQSPARIMGSQSNTLAKLNENADFDSSPSSDLSTPTRKPSRHRPSASHPNRRRPVFDSSCLTQWPLATSHPTLSLGLRASGIQETPNVFQLDAQINTDESREEAQQPATLLHCFPSPPSLLNSSDLLETFGSKQPRKPSPRGPRTPPRSLRHGRNRNAPAKSKTTNMTTPPHGKKSSVDMAASDLRKSVIALRRMNSEITNYSESPHRHQIGGNGNGGNREHRRYLSLSNHESCSPSDAMGDDVDSRAHTIAYAETEPAMWRRDGIAESDNEELRGFDGSEQFRARGTTSNEFRGMLYSKRRAKGPRPMPGILDEEMFAKALINQPAYPNRI